MFAAEQWFLGLPNLFWYAFFVLAGGISIAYGEASKKKHTTSNPVPPEIAGNPEAVRKWLDQQNPQTGETNAESTDPLRAGVPGGSNADDRRNS